jgi:3-hydroxymyristoyl/3-hydroxydecanoyl-(acyl carrier protein) dehydratase
MVQAVGGLVMATHGWGVLPFLLLVEDARVPPALGPGTRLDLVGEIVSTNPQGTVARATASVDGATVASAERIVLGHFPVKDAAALRERFRRMGAVP